MNKKLDKDVISIELSASLLPRYFRAKHKNHINIRYCSPGHDYLFQDMSVTLFAIFYTIFWNMISNYLYDLCKKSKKTDLEIPEVIYENATGKLNEYKKLISRARRRVRKTKGKVSRDLKLTLDAHEKALALMEKPQALQKKINQSLRKISKKL
ncbi:MAG: hypothetical protein HZA50_02880 [Planctomycetes bacterium]|nr:hypothetical protein [Planctomycetota bacterium]